jgi:hypothetical protein
MRKFCLAAVAAMTATLGAASAQEVANNPLIVWHGAATLTNVPATAACTNVGFAIGDTALSVFRPRLNPEEPSSAISMSFGRSAMAFFRQTAGSTSSDQMHGNSAYSSPWFSGRATSTQGGNTGNITLTLSPSSVLATTNVVTIVGSITNFAGKPGCTVQFKGSYYRRPN